MFFNKLILGAGFGAIIGIIAMFGEIHDGKSFSDAAGAIPSVMLAAIVLTFWWTRNTDSGGGDDMQTSSNQIQKLQHELMRAAQAEADYISRGMRSEAVYWHSQVVLIESQLRRLGA